MRPSGWAVGRGVGAPAAHASGGRPETAVLLCVVLASVVCEASVASGAAALLVAVVVVVASVVCVGSSTAVPTAAPAAASYMTRGSSAMTPIERLRARLGAFATCGLTRFRVSLPSGIALSAQPARLLG